MTAVVDLITNDINESRLRAVSFLRAYHAFLECSDGLQDAVREMARIALDENCDKDERDMAISTIAEILFPDPRNEVLGCDLEESEKMDVESLPQAREILNEMDQQESTFADRLGALMRARHISQSALAKRIGVRQPAISMILKRKCRPQERTIQKLAKALDVAPEELWPGDND